MYPESSAVDWITLSRALQVCGFAVDIYVVVVLYRAYRAICERNKQIAQNTRILERHNRLIETVGKILISLYPDHDHPEEQITFRARKGRVVEMLRRANEDE